MNSLFGQIKQIWSRLSAGQKLVIGALLATMLIAGVTATLVGGGTDWRPLDGVERANVAKLLNKLDEAAIPYRLHGSKSIEVAADRWGDVQTLLVKNDIVASGTGGGYDSLDSLPFGITDKQRELKMRVAAERELAQTVAQIDGIESAKIHITPARRSWNKRDSTPAKASVVVRSRPGRMLPSGSIEAVVQLVAGAVPGLEPSRVVVSDATLGIVLSRPAGADSGMMERTSHAREHEQYLQEKAESALVRALGPGKAVVRVDAELDLEAVDTTESMILPETKVTTRERNKVSENRADEPRGNVSTAAIQSGQSQGEQGGSNTEENEADYEFSRRTVRRSKGRGEVKRITVGVMVDESLRDREQAIANVVKGSVGFKSGRDVFEVAFVPFAEVEIEKATMETAGAESGILMDLVQWGVTGVLGLVIVLFLWRSARRARESVQGALDRALEESKKWSKRKADPKHEILRLVNDDVETVGNTLRNWLYEPAGK